MVQRHYYVFEWSLSGYAARQQLHGEAEERRKGGQGAPL